MKLYINNQHLIHTIEYPERYRAENLFKSALVVFVTLSVFLLLFTPFGVYEPEHKMNYFFICALHAFSPALILFVYFSILNYSRKLNTTENWNLLKEYIHIGTFLVLAGIASFLMRDLIYNNDGNWSLRYLWEEIRNCFVAGIFFYFFLRVVSFYFQSHKDSPFVLHFKPLKVEPEKKVIESVVFIQTQVKQDDFSLDTDSLLFVKAEGNYIVLTKMINGKIETELKRISLTQFENQISACSYFFRCHRAYLVNMFKVQKVTGNSQGYLLSFENTTEKVPVSRKQLDNFNSCYEQLRHKGLA
ncbi:LytR/AlgR family response regulator transcription factor [Flavobacterium branchiicola]|uniref:LytR/AlgR family response regulator transcription factor n=1 Tax=Flavobacterium branchiicola TaxID=1114875 RepID=A0ABV9P9T6_9FLAO|nr:LytTR family DNA-binding domain-containing protein [Flavobacterium branchiicola]MBS7252490.1 LytTR family transcriptional regulator DNA-binding domain-containing protein [Flavobacterium branchiicola]